MAEPVGSIHVDLGLSAASFHAGLTAAGAQVERFERRTRLSLRSAALGFTSFGRGLAGALGVGLGAASLSGLVSAAKEATSQFGALAEAARTVGLSTDTLQALEFAGLQEGVENISGALQRFAVNVGQAAAGGGAFRSFLEKTNPALLEQLRLAGDHEDRLRLVADAFAGAGSAADQAALAQAAFGRSGVELGRILGDGAACLKRFEEQARELGIVVDRGLILRADELGDQLDVAAKVIDTNFKQALVDVVPILVTVSDFVADLREGKSATEALTGALDRMADRLIDMALDGAISGLFSGGLRPGGPVDSSWSGLRGFSDGGITRRPAIFGEDGPEAAVPLPDGRSIPVTLRMPPTRAAVGGAPSISVPVVNNGEPLRVTGQRERRTADGGIELEVLVGQMVAREMGRSGSAPDWALRDRGISRPLTRR